MRQSLRETGGYTLLEMLTISVVLVVLMTVCLKMYMSFDRLRTAADGIMTTQERIAELDSEFRDSFRTPGRLVDSFQDYRSSGSLMIFRHRDQDTVTLVGSALNAEDFSVVRWRKVNEEWEISYLKTILFDHPEFMLDVDDDNLVRLSLQSKSFRASRSLPDHVTLYAAISSGDPT